MGQIEPFQQDAGVDAVQTHILSLPRRQHTRSIRTVGHTSEVFGPRGVVRSGEVCGMPTARDVPPRFDTFDLLSDDYAAQSVGWQ